MRLDVWVRNGVQGHTRDSAASSESSGGLQEVDLRTIEAAAEGCVLRNTGFFIASSRQIQSGNAAHRHQPHVKQQHICILRTRNPVAVPIQISPAEAIYTLPHLRSKSSTDGWPRMISSPCTSLPALLAHHCTATTQCIAAPHPNCPLHDPPASPASHYSHTVETKLQHKQTMQ
jgi:hypothetical protein